MADGAQPDSSEDTVRLKSYKYKGLGFEEGRRKRQEESVSLRKSKREDQVFNNGSHWSNFFLGGGGGGGGGGEGGGRCVEMIFLNYITNAWPVSSINLV